PTGDQVFPPSSERWMSCPNQPVDCEAYSLSGFAGDPATWYISQPAKCGPLTSHRSRRSSELRMNAPLRVPTSTRTPLMTAPRPPARCRIYWFARSSRSPLERLGHHYPDDQVRYQAKPAS